MPVAVVIAAFLALTAPAMAQGLAPMRQDYATYAERFAVRLIARNPYPEAQRFEVRAFDADWRPAADVETPAFISVAPHETASFLVVGPAGGEGRRLYVCLRSAPRAGASGAPMRGEACGSYRIVRRRL